MIVLADSRVQWRRVLAFSAVAYALSWAWWAPLVWPHLGRVTFTGPVPEAVHEAGASRVALGMFGPALAALIMRVLGGERLEGSLGVRRPWRFYLLAVAAPVLFVVTVVLLDVVSGLARFVSSGSLIPTFLAVLVVGSAAGVPFTIGEEYGWRGYLLPHLLPLGEVKATVVLAAIWGMWHTPLLLIGLNYPAQPLWAVLLVFAAAVGLLAFPFTWVYLWSGGSVLVVAVMHSVLNALGDTFTSPRYITDGNPLLASAGGLVGTGVLFAVIAIVGTFRRAGRGRHDQRESTAMEATQR